MSQRIPPVYRNNNENQNRDFRIVKDNSDEYELQTQTEPKREEIPPRRPVEKNPLVVYVVLPTIDGKEEKIDFNKIQSQPYLLSFMPTNGIVKMQYNYTPYNYTDKFLMYISCGIPAETSNQIITYLDQLSKQNDFSIDKIPNLSIKGFEFQFINSDNYKSSKLFMSFVFCLKFSRSSGDISICNPMIKFCFISSAVTSSSS